MIHHDPTFVDGLGKGSKNNVSRRSPPVIVERLKLIGTPAKSTNCRLYAIQHSLAPSVGRRARHQLPPGSVNVKRWALSPLKLRVDDHDLGRASAVFWSPGFR